MLLAPPQSGSLSSLQYVCWVARYCIGFRFLVRYRFSTTSTLPSGQVSRLFLIFFWLAFSFFSTHPSETMVYGYFPKFS